MTKAPLGKEKIGPNPTDHAKRGVKRSLFVEGTNRNDFKTVQVRQWKVFPSMALAHTKAIAAFLSG
jgi:hypothetical protein